MASNFETMAVDESMVTMLSRLGRTFSLVSTALDTIGP